MSAAGWIDELERDLGQAARLRLIANAGGQRRRIPSPRHAPRSALAREMGPAIALWLARRFAPNDEILIPTRHGMSRRQAASRLAAAVIEAGLTDPLRSANDIAAEHGVSADHIYRLRRELRGEQIEDAQEAHPPRQRDLFRDP